MKHYRTILADPPWGVRSQIGARNRHYSLMPIEDICALRVQRLVAENAHLWLWVTNAEWHAQLAVMEAWGFSYRSCLTWIKPRLGMGQYLRNQTEHLLLGVRGRLPLRFRGQGTWLYAPVQEHSHKPEETVRGDRAVLAWSVPGVVRPPEAAGLGRVGQ
jgi:N6-adenosine-specific RNA methylase IME4